MELIKWVLSVIVAFTLTLVGIGVSIGALVFLAFFKILGILGIVTAGVAVMVKDKIDERSDR
jgi:hypothetical protein